MTSTKLSITATIIIGILDIISSQHIGSQPPFGLSDLPTVPPGYEFIPIHSPDENIPDRRDLNHEINYRLLKRNTGNFHSQQGNRNPHAHAHLPLILSSAVKISDHGYRKPPVGHSKPMQPVVLQALRRINDKNNNQQKINAFKEDLDANDYDYTLINDHKLLNGMIRDGLILSNQQSFRPQNVFNVGRSKVVPKNSKNSLSVRSKSPTPSPFRNSHFDINQFPTPRSNIDYTPFVSSEEDSKTGTPSYRHYVNNDYADVNGHKPNPISNTTPLSRSLPKPTRRPPLNINHIPVTQKHYQNHSPVTNIHASYHNPYSPVGYKITSTAFPHNSVSPAGRSIQIFPTTPQPDVRNYVQKKPITAPPNLVPERHKKKKSYTPYVSSTPKPTVALVKEDLGFDRFAEYYDYQNPYFNPIYPTPLPHSLSYPTSAHHNPSVSFASFNMHNYPTPTPYSVVPNYSFNNNGPNYEIDYDDNPLHRERNFHPSYPPPHTHHIKTRSPDSSHFNEDLIRDSILETAGRDFEDIISKVTMRSKLNDDPVKVRPNEIVNSPIKEHSLKDVFDFSFTNKNNMDLLPKLSTTKHARSTPASNGSRVRQSRRIKRPSRRKSTNERTSELKRNASNSPSPTRKRNNVNYGPTLTPNLQISPTISVKDPEPLIPKFNLPIPSPALSGLPFYIAGHEGLGPFIINSVGPNS